MLIFCSKFIESILIFLKKLWEESKKWPKASVYVREMLFSRRDLKGPEDSYFGVWLSLNIKTYDTDQKYNIAIKSLINSSQVWNCTGTLLIYNNYRDEKYHKRVIHQIVKGNTAQLTERWWIKISTNNLDLKYGYLSS